MASAPGLPLRGFRVPALSVAERQWPEDQPGLPGGSFPTSGKRHIPKAFSDGQETTSLSTWAFLSDERATRRSLPCAHTHTQRMLELICSWEPFLGPRELNL